MERFMVVYFTEPQIEGAAMPSWHQHMTVVPWAEGDVRETTRALMSALEAVEPFEMQVRGRDTFGPDRNIPVYRLEPEAILRGLHAVALAVVEEYARLAVDHEFVGQAYKPHITPKANQPERAVGDAFLLDHLTVVQRLKHARLIYRNVALGNEAAA